MGSSMSEEQRQSRDIGRPALNALKSHKNYKDLKPKDGESLCAYTLRYVGNVISPPQEAEESCDIECIAIKAALPLLEYEIEERWRKFNGLI